MRRSINADELLSFINAIKDKHHSDELISMIEGYIESHAYPPLKEEDEGVIVYRATGKSKRRYGI